MLSNRLRYPSLLLFVVVFFSYGPQTMAADDDILTVRITQGIESAPPIAVVRFVPDLNDATGAKIVETLQEVIAGDLGRSGRLRVADPSAYPERPADFVSVNFEKWQASEAQHLVIGRLVSSSGGVTNVEIRLVDVFGASQVLGYRIPTSLKSARITGHQIADLVYRKLTNEAGVFATRVAYVAVEKDPKGQKLYRLKVADSDGYNAQTLLESREPVLSPAWSPDGRSLAYASLEGSRATLFVQDLRSGQRTAVSSGAGLHSAPAFSPDGSRLALTISKDGNPDIYLYSMKSKRLSRLTRHPAIDTEPTFSPDGLTIAFTSDRGGGPQIYTMNLANPKPRRLSFDMGSYNARPRYAPDGKSMAVVTRGASGFHVGIIDLERRFIRIVSDGGLDESPSFAPNGYLIMYATRVPRGTELAVVSIDGKVKQRLGIRSGEVREPAWGPLIN